MTKPQFGAFAPDFLNTCALACVWTTVFFAPAATAQSTDNFTISHLGLSPEVRPEVLHTTAPIDIDERSIAPFVVHPKVMALELQGRVARVPYAKIQRVFSTQ